MAGPRSGSSYNPAALSIVVPDIVGLDERWKAVVDKVNI